MPDYFVIAPVTSMYVHNINAPTVAASSATTFTNAVTLNIVGCPLAGANVTLPINTCVALRVGGGVSQLNGTVNVGAGLNVSGATNIVIASPSAVTIGSTLNTVSLKGGRVDEVDVITAAGAVTVDATMNHVCINKTTGAATAANLPATPTTGQMFTIDDCKGDAATNNITVTPAAGNIDGAATFVISTNYGSWTGYYTGTIWKTTAAR